MNYNDALSQRYSVKKFDKEKTISKAILENILKAGQLSASSLGLQPYKIFVIEKEEDKTQLTPAFYNPSQISTCSHLIAIVTKKTLEKDYLDGYMKHITEVRKVTLESLQMFRKSIEGYVERHSDEGLATWNEKQSYILLGHLMFAAALEQVDSCPMEGFNAEMLSDYLGLDQDKEQVSVTLALGYRAEDDPFQHMKKVRKPNDKLFKFL
ncbi:NAD(P)H-dependent oxidoreductase [Riemerella columbina]|uniref:NAD(P)H-dependent oxidoreductase n=1 Tax=Riemerella columbina TaxID=103810 RepID=UPI0003724E6E|nr:NAD(P)H-dependent oxidoreductase [Riemerella columbina]